MACYEFHPDHGPRETFLAVDDHDAQETAAKRYRGRAGAIFRQVLVAEQTRHVSRAVPPDNAR